MVLSYEKYTSSTRWGCTEAYEGGKFTVKASRSLKLYSKMSETNSESEGCEHQNLISDKHEGMEKKAVRNRKDKGEHQQQQPERRKKQETTEERVARIGRVKVSFAEFFANVLDHEQLKAFLILWCAFFISCGVLSVMYLAFLFTFKRNLWDSYFPVSSDMPPKGEL